MDEPIKLAFQKVKQDIDFLNNKLDLLTQHLHKNENQLDNLMDSLANLTNKLSDCSNMSNLVSPANQHNIPTNVLTSPADNCSFKPLKDSFSTFSTGNGGVPADRQTDQQTDQQTIRQANQAPFNQAVEILGSLDNIKAEIKAKFKKITDQEFLVFSTIYQIEEEQGYVDYKILSQRLNLTESSIRDYVGKLIRKGIPLSKTKENNKIIHLSISNNLKKIVPLPSIFQLRGL